MEAKKRKINEKNKTKTDIVKKKRVK